MCFTVAESFGDFDAENRARQYYCRALCKIWKWFEDWNEFGFPVSVFFLAGGGVLFCNSPQKKWKFVLIVALVNTQTSSGRDTNQRNVGYDHTESVKIPGD